MKNLALALAAVGAIALSAPTSSSAAPLGVRIAPQVDGGAEQVRYYCWHQYYSSRRRCRQSHSRWSSRRYYRHRHYHSPGIYFRF